MTWRRVVLHSAILTVLMFGAWVPVAHHQDKPWPEVWLLPLILVGVAVGILIITTDRVPADRKDRR
jgi:predicted membrane channel-forming protein YqfA (hemolysin III family)